MLDDKAVMASAALCEVSTRRCAVTTISSNPVDSLPWAAVSPAAFCAQAGLDAAADYTQAQERSQSAHKSAMLHFLISTG